MNKILTIILALLTISVFGQKNPTEEAQSIVADTQCGFKKVFEHMEL